MSTEQHKEVMQQLEQLQFCATVINALSSHTLNEVEGVKREIYKTVVTISAKVDAIASGVAVRRTFNLGGFKPILFDAAQITNYASTLRELTEHMKARAFPECGQAQNGAAKAATPPQPPVDRQVKEGGIPKKEADTVADLLKFLTPEQLIAQLDNVVAEFKRHGIKGYMALEKWLTKDAKI